MITRTLVLIKPDAVERGLIGKVISRFEDRGLKIVGLKLLQADKDTARNHYGDFVERYADKLGREKAHSIIDEMVSFMTSGPLVAMAVEGVNAVPLVRKLVGSTYPSESPVGTIRGDYAHVSQDYANSVGITIKNIVHASGNDEEAQIELKTWFKEDELTDYSVVHDKHTIK